MKVGFIGAGHMGSTIANKLKAPGLTIAKFDHHLPVIMTQAQIAKTFDVIVFGVKPQDLATAISEVKNSIASRDNVLVVSMAAGKTIASIKEMLGCDLPVMRIMPNTPVEVDEGVIAWTMEGESEFAEPFLEALSAAGMTAKVEEDDMDAITALSGSGPAFVYRFINALARGGEAAGLPKEDSIILATQTVLGAAKLLQESNATPDELCEKVCSPGGTTIAGIEKLDSTHFEDDVIDTVVAAFSRSCELSGD